MSDPGAVRAATTLALWAAAWQGGASADDVLAALDDAGHRAGVRAATHEIADATGLPGPGAPSAGSASLLPLLRAGGPADLLLPRAGDLRGLPPAGSGPRAQALMIAALDAGAVVLLSDAGLALLPVDGQWRAFGCRASHPALDLPCATEYLDLAIRGATRTLTALEVARSSPRATDAIRQHMLAAAVHTPPGIPAAASATLARAISMEALLAVAVGHDTAAATSAQVAAVDDALRPLTAAVAEARRAAVAAAVRTLRERPRANDARSPQVAHRRR